MRLSTLFPITIVGLLISGSLSAETPDDRDLSGMAPIPMPPPPMPSYPDGAPPPAMGYPAYGYPAVGPQGFARPGFGSGPVYSDGNTPPSTGASIKPTMDVDPAAADANISRAGTYPGYPPRHRRPTGLRVSQTMTDEAYVLEIPLDGQAPESIQIEPRGHGLLIRRDSSTQRTEERTYNSGRGYSRRYSYSGGRQSRRLSVPGDANLAALSREDSAEQVRVLIPRRQP